jgi:FkbM family methyltransferase
MDQYTQGLKELMDSLKPKLKYLGRYNFDLDPKWYIDRAILRDQVWEPHMLWYFGRFIKRGGFCVDVGANAGYLTLPMADVVGPDGTVMAFEPNPEMRARLDRNAGANPDIGGRILISPYALGHHQMSCTVVKHGLSGDIGLGNAHVEMDAGGEGKMIPLDDVPLPACDFMKIDVEGMEYNVLLGAKATIEKFHPYIVFETQTCLPPVKHTPAANFLKSLGYRLCVPCRDGKALQELDEGQFPESDTFAIHETNMLGETSCRLPNG